MPINFGGYMFRPTPLAIGGMGEGLDSIIQANQEKARLGQQESQYARTRRDTQGTNAATFARDNANTAFDTQKGKYDKQLKAIADARAAGQSGHYDVADALIPTITALGGEARMNPDGKTYYFREGAAPTRGAPDFAGARRDIYGQEGPQVSAPFQVPGFGADGQRNPFEPSSVAGASASQLPSGPQQSLQPQSGPPPQPGAQPGQPPVDAAGPPPGAAVDGPLTPPAGAVWLPPEAPSDTPQPSSAEADLAALNAVDSEQAGQPGSPQATGPNPFTPPALDQYTIDPEKVRERNNDRLQPFLGGVAKAAGSRYQGRIEAINKYVSELGLPPDEAIKVTEKLYGEVFGLARSELQMEGQSGRAAQTARHQESVEYDKDRDRGIRIAKERMNLYDLKGTHKKLEVSRGVEDLIKSAHRNGATANALIRQVYNMYAAGVMTDNDYTDTKEGVNNLFQRVKNRTLQELNPHGGGLPPNILDDMKELVEVALRGHRRVAAETSDSLYRAYKANRNEAEREAIRESFSAFPEEFLPAEFNPRASGGGAEGEQAEMERMAAEEPGSQIDPNSYDPTSGPPPLGDDNLGVAPMPKEPNRAGAAKGSRVPTKPARKAVKDMTPEERKARMEELLRKSREP